MKNAVMIWLILIARYNKYSRWDQLTREQYQATVENKEISLHTYVHIKNKMEELVPPSPTSSMSSDTFEKAMGDWRFVEAVVAVAEPDSSSDSFGDDRSYSDRSFPIFNPNDLSGQVTQTGQISWQEQYGFEL